MQNLNATPAQQQGARRATEQDAVATRNGFPPKQLLFAIGQPVLESGRRTYLLQRSRIEEQPWIDEPCNGVIEAVAAEHREEHTVPTASLRMEDDGSLTAGSCRYSMEEDAFLQLVTRLGMRKAGPYLVDCPPDLRAYNVNRYLDEAAQGCREIEVVGEDGTTSTEVGAALPEHLMLRTRNGSGPRRIFAVLSDQYRILDSDDVAAAARDALPSDARGDAVYDGSRVRITATWMSEIAVDSLVVGDILRAGVRVRSGDVGNEATKVFAFVHQARCVNLTQVTRSVECLRLVHLGHADMLEELRAGIARALDKVRPFLDTWHKAGLERIVDESLHHADVEPAIVRVVERRLVPKVVGVSDTEMVRRIRACYWKSPSPTVRGIVDAVTRVAHEASWSSPWVQDDMQEAAGQLVHNYVCFAKVARQAQEEAKALGWQPGRFTLDEVQAGVLQTVPVFQFRMAEV